MLLKISMKVYSDPRHLIIYCSCLMRSKCDRIKVLSSTTVYMPIGIFLGNVDVIFAHEFYVKYEGFAQDK